MPSSRLPDHIKISGQVFRNHYLVAYNLSSSKSSQVDLTFSLKGSEVAVSAMLFLHTDSPFLSDYVNITKEYKRVTQKWAPHHHLMSRDLPVMSSGQSIDGHVISVEQPCEYHEILVFLLWDFQLTSTSFSSAGLNRGFTELPQCKYLCFLFMVVKQVPLRICSLMFAIKKFWGRHSFHHEEISSRWLHCYSVTSSQHTQPLCFNVANMRSSPPWSQSRFLSLIKDHCLAT